MPDHAQSPVPACSSPARPHDARVTGLISGPVPILTAALVWGTTGTASLLAPAIAPAAAVGSAGLALGGVLLFLSTRTARVLIRACPWRDRWLLALGAIAVAGYPVSFYPAVARCGVAVPNVIALGSAPAFAGLLAWLTRQSRPTSRWTCATAAAVLGCAALILGPALTGGTSPVSVTGVTLSLAAGLSYATYSLISGKLISGGHPPGAVMGVMFGGGAVLVLPVVLTSDMRWLVTFRGASVVTYLAVMTTFLAYRLFGHGLRNTSAQIATTLTLAEPATATVLGVVVLGEQLPPLSWAGLAVLASGLAILALPAIVTSRPGHLRVSEVTTAKSYRLLKAVLNTALDDGVIRRNPCRIKGAGQEKSAERPTLTIAQVYALADGVGQRYRALILLAMFTSLRWGELAALRRCDIDLEARTVRVVRQLGEVNGLGFVYGPPKSEAGQRTVAIPEVIIAVVQWHVTCFAEDGPDGLVFTGSEGGPLHHSNFRGRVWLPAVRRAELSGIHFHDLRHTGNTLAARSGATLRELMDRMGHDSQRAAMIYLHGSTARQQEIADTLSKLAVAELKRGTKRAPGKSSGTQRARNRRTTG